MNSASSSVPLASAGTRSSEPFAVAGLAALALAILWWRWVGYQGHDDLYYAGAALDWVENFPALGTNHWALRYPLVLPTAAVIALFGPSVWALAAVNLAAYAGFLVVGYLAVRHWFGPLAAILVTLIGIVLPQFPVQATYANPDFLEMALVMASFWTLMLARERGGPTGLLLLCGLLAGFAFLTRETTLSLLVFFGLLFLFRPAMPRWRYFVIGAGFLLVVGAQLAYFAARTGDPLHRMSISATHDRVDRSAKPAEAASAGRALDSEGVLAASPVVAPLAAIFVSQKYGLLFFLAIPAYLVARRRGSALSDRQRSVLDCAAVGALVAFLFVAVNATLLYVVPRYFMVPAALAAVPVAVVGARWLRAGGLRQGVAALLALGFVVSSLLLLYLENVEPMRAEERLVEVVAATPEVVHVHPETAGRMAYLLRVRGLQGRVSIEPPGPGALVGVKQGVVEECRRRPNCPFADRNLPFAPGPSWRELARYEPPRRLIAVPVRALGLDRLVPADILRKIEQPGVDAVVYRVGP